MSSAEISFRTATADDVPRLLEMLEPFVRARKLLRRTPEEVAVLTRHGFIAEDEGEIVGFSAIEIYSRKLAEIQSLAVADGYQNRGIGRKLVMRCLDRARELDVMEVLAISASDDFLRSCGFDYSLPDQKRALFCQLRQRSD
ncbi:GNAT family N-acetyltransferase [Candidatus Laterigemmans baculatus]|uniref:GNAT family N-acetyltransferase n=1 Tax=Candidatus Laterigemmans baculatus TaxID=2770505 RepID=UPI0013D9071A|nr:GNAT family N-acetyltransferase [Candidatus Laterigemmans baculatus]